MLVSPFQFWYGSLYVYAFGMSFLVACVYLDSVTVSKLQAYLLFALLHGYLCQECMFGFSDCLGFDNPGSMLCQSLIRRRGAAGGVCLITMPAGGSLSQMHTPLPLRGCLHHCLVIFHVLIVFAICHLWTLAEFHLQV